MGLKKVNNNKVNIRLQLSRCNYFYTCTYYNKLYNYKYIIIIIIIIIIMVYLFPLEGARVVPTFMTNGKVEIVITTYTYE